MLNSTLTDMRLHDASGALMARTNWVICFYLPNPPSIFSLAVKRIFTQWLDMLPAGLIKWGLVGASAEEAKSVADSTVSRCRGMLDLDKVAKRDITAFELFGPQDENPDHLFGVVGDRDYSNDFSSELPDPVGAVEIWFPLDYMSPADVATFAQAIADELPYYSGYASPAITFGPLGNAYDAGAVIKGFAPKYPGFDLPFQEGVRYEVGDKAIGARWLTFLGPRLVSRLGGEEALVVAAPSVEVSQVGHGILLRAGANPEIGDANRNIGTPLLRELARAIESVTVFDVESLKPLFQDDEDAFMRWERRFLD